MPGAIATLIWGGWFLLMPVLFIGLAALGARHDRLSAAVTALAGLGFLLQLSAVLRGWPSQMLSPTAAVGLAGVALCAFALRLWRDRRLRHVRSSAESVMVLAMGAVFLIVLLSLPRL